MHARTLALPAALVCLMFSACSDSDPRSPGAGTPGVAGSVTGGGSGDALDGPWVVTSSPRTSNCGPLNVLFETTTVMTIAQAGNDFNFTMTDDCGTPIPGGTGSVDPGGTLTFRTEVNRNLTTTCQLRLTQDWTAFAQFPADQFTGSTVLSVVNSQQPGMSSCGPSLPCTVTGTFTAVRCPRTGCDVTCTP